MSRKCWFLPTGSHSTESPCLHRGRDPWEEINFTEGGRESLCTVGTVASGHRSLIVRSVIPGPVVCPILEFLEHFVEKCRAYLVRHWIIRSVITMEYLGIGNTV